MWSVDGSCTFACTVMMSMSRESEALSFRWVWCQIKYSLSLSLNKWHFFCFCGKLICSPGIAVRASKPTSNLNLTVLWDEQLWAARRAPIRVWIVALKSRHLTLDRILAASVSGSLGNFVQCERKCEIYYDQWYMNNQNKRLTYHWYTAVDSNEMKAMHAHCARSIMEDGREVQVPPSHQLISASSNYVVVLVPCDVINAQVIFIHQSSKQ